MKKFDLTKYLSNNILLKEIKVSNNKKTISINENIGEFITKLFEDGMDDITNNKALANKLNISEKLAKKILDQADNVYVPRKDRALEYEKIVNNNLKSQKMTKSSLKQKIKEMVLAEIRPSYDPTDKDDPQFYELKKDLASEYINTNGDISAEDLATELGVEFELASQILNDLYGNDYSDLDEAKKKDTEDAPEEEIKDTEVEEIPLDTPDEKISTDQVDPIVKDIQDALTQAQAAAEKLNDDKLSKQIGNTITMFTRSHISNKSTENGLEEMLKEDEQFPTEDDINDYTEIMVNLEEPLEALTSNKFIDSEDDLSKHAHKMLALYYEIDLMVKQIIGTDQESDYSKNHNEEGGEIEEGSSQKYSFKDLIYFIKRSDLNNPNNDKREDCESKLQKIGFYNEDGEIRPKNFQKDFKTTDGKTLDDLEAWFEENMT